MNPQANPFAVLSLIVAPAILTNASSVLAMSTSNRLARAVDRARELSRQLESGSGVEEEGEQESARRLNELAIIELRAVLLMRVLRSFYVALGAFAVATLTSLLGAVLALFWSGYVVGALEVLAVAAGIVAVTSLVRGSAILVRETGMAVQMLHERAESARARLQRLKRR